MKVSTILLAAIVGIALYEATRSTSEQKKAGQYTYPSKNPKIPPATPPPVELFPVETPVPVQTSTVAF